MSQSFVSSSRRELRVFAMETNVEEVTGNIPSAPISLPEGSWKQVAGGVTAAKGFKAAGMYAGLRSSGKKPDLALVTCAVEAVAPAISWKSSKQTLLLRSTMESEFIALDKAAEEAEWLRNFLEDVPMWEKPVPALHVHCDSQSAISRALNSLYNGKSRHIRRRHKTIRQLISTGVLTIDYIKTADNLADPFTKSLPRDKIEKSSKGMGLKPIDKDDV